MYMQSPNLEQELEAISNKIILTDVERSEKQLELLNTLSVAHSSILTKYINLYKEHNDGAEPSFEGDNYMELAQSISSLTQNIMLLQNNELSLNKRRNILSQIISNQKAAAFDEPAVEPKKE